MGCGASNTKHGVEAEHGGSKARMIGRPLHAQGEVVSRFGYETTESKWTRHVTRDKVAVDQKEQWRQERSVCKESGTERGCIGRALSKRGPLDGTGEGKREKKPAVRRANTAPDYDRPFEIDPKVATAESEIEAKSVMKQDARRKGPDQIGSDGWGRKESTELYRTDIPELRNTESGFPGTFGNLTSTRPKLRKSQSLLVD